MAGGQSKKACKCCAQEGLRRGVWSAQEDKILTTYINVHGEGKWRELPLKAGLRRCGRSCRLRWLNYLRPDIKRGDISSDEEDLIFRLHKLLGNRWSLIAGRLPGRTDNEIKNYWNTHLVKKLQGKKLRKQRKNSKTEKKVSKEEEKMKEENNPDFIKASVTEPEGNQVGFNNSELELGGESSPQRVCDSLGFLMDAEMDDFAISDFFNSDFLQVHCDEIPIANNATGGDDGINNNLSYDGMNNNLSYCFDHSFPSHEIAEGCAKETMVKNETGCNSVQSSSSWELDKLWSFLGLEDERQAMD